MSDAHLPVEQLLPRAAQQVLETMFFVTLLDGASDDAEPEPRLWFKIRFQGNPPGLFWLGIGRQAARFMAAGFLGAEAEDELGESQVESVMGELANVICGAALSRLESDSAFELQVPEQVPEPGPEEAPGAVRCSLAMDCGRLDLWLALESTS